MGYFNYKKTFLSLNLLFSKMNKFILLSALVASASAFTVAPAGRASTAVFQDKPDWEAAAELGWSMGGEDYTRSVEEKADPDARKSIHKGESFEEYMKNRQ